MANNARLKDDSVSRDLNILMVIVTGLLVFIMAARTPLDTDFWWHIRAGEVTWQTGKPLLTDQFTFTRQGQPWTNHSWLAEVILYLVFQAWGYLGVSLMVALLAAGSMLLIYAQLEGPALLKSAIIILASTVAAPVWTPRPQLFSQVLFAGLYLILYRYRINRFDRLWVLPILFLVWSNLHAGYTLGFLLLGVFIAGELLNWVLHPRTDRRSAWHSLRKLILWTVVCFLVVLINPNGLETWWVPFKTVGINVLRASIDEWASPDFHQLALQPFLWLLFAVLAAAGLSGRKMDVIDLIGLIGFAYLAFLAKRNFAPFAIFAAPLLSRYLWKAVSAWREERSDGILDGNRRVGRLFSQPLASGLRRGLNLILVILLLCAAGIKLAMVTRPDQVEKTASIFYPVKAVEHLQSETTQGRIFNSYSWGGYLEWYLPDFPVFIDGRTDLFGDEIAGVWINTIQAGEGWEETFSNWDIRYCLIEPNRPLAEALKESGARVLYEDQTSILFELSE